LRIHTAALTHVGLRRVTNEDCIAIGARALNESMSEPWVAVHRLDQPCVCLVADGMGGHPAGDVASHLAAEHLAVSLAEPEASDHTLVAAVHSANRALFTEMARFPAYYGMGTTLAGIVAHESGVRAVNVGDSRVYAFQSGSLEQISIDDVTETGPSPTLARVPARMLIQCLGGYAGCGDIEPHLVRLPAAEGAGFLICSDGLYDMLSDRDIAACLNDDLARSVRLLFESAMDEGGIDNISIIYARIVRAGTD
ncbi:MAG: serine/threonine-protein phosphatase, partial [Betaproteobacteria bacterium]